MVVSYAQEGEHQEMVVRCCKDRRKSEPSSMTPLGNDTRAASGPGQHNASTAYESTSWDVKNISRPLCTLLMTLCIQTKFKQVDAPDFDGGGLFQRRMYDVTNSKGLWE